MWYKSKVSKGLPCWKSAKSLPSLRVFSCICRGASIINYSRNVIKSEDSEKQMLWDLMPSKSLRFIYSSEEGNPDYCLFSNTSRTVLHTCLSILTSISVCNCQVQFSSVQSLSRVRLFSTPWIAARQASLSITNSRSALQLTSIQLVMPSSHLILCRPLFLLPPIPPSIRVFSNESTLPNCQVVLINLIILSAILLLRTWFTHN